MKPLLSIVIPTKDRYNTLVPVLNGLVKYFANLNVEIVVQDNTKNNEIIIEALNKIVCEKIKYFHTISPISMSENCDQSILNSKGKYLIMIGDDDFVLPSILESVIWMDDNQVECLNSNTAAYYWPDISFKYQTKSSTSASLLLSLPLSKEYVSIDPIKELNKVIVSGGTDYANLPRLYHGVVKREALDRIFKKCQTFFPGPSPDMANSAALAIFVKKFNIYNFPFSISGKSFSSAAGKGVNHTHNGNLDKMPFLDQKLIAKWNNKIPYFWSGDTIYAQSLYHCLRVCDYYAKINFNKLYAHLLVFERASILRDMKPVKRALFEEPLSIFVILFWYFVFTKRRAIDYFIRKVFPEKKYIIYNKVNQIDWGKKIIENVNC